MKHDSAIASSFSTLTERDLGLRRNDSKKDDSAGPVPASPGTRRSDSTFISV